MHRPRRGLLLRLQEWFWWLPGVGSSVTPGPTRFVVSSDEAEFTAINESRFVAASSEAEFTAQ